ncbi:hypothetical protein OsJ_23072 [Oryza sativa Japonica Group]|uniref:Uncharacterized protein n=1 Tax=Oryza sativa subsp. japonica TaxID=39947 RepID=B9FVG8_ORYSJ|nr:hypothetical protein OsJ_23072 [Oryza sativa Japonica Group]
MAGWRRATRQATVSGWWRSGAARRTGGDNRGGQRGEEAGNGVWWWRSGGRVWAVVIGAGAEMGVAESDDAALAVEIGDPQCRRRGRVWGSGKAAPAAMGEGQKREGEGGGGA